MADKLSNTLSDHIANLIKITTVSKSISVSANTWVSSYFESNVDFPSGEIIGIYATTGYAHADFIIADVSNNNGKIRMGYVAYSTRSNASIAANFKIITKVSP